MLMDCTDLSVKVVKVLGYMQVGWSTDDEVGYSLETLLDSRAASKFRRRMVWRRKD